jgi:two-component system, OmpR family, lantibiotic biosynthesis response regulator NisR/SpaR
MQNAITLALADDDEVHSELVTAWLEARGHRVVRFASGDALVGWARDGGEPVDVFLLDVDMPGRNGFESCRALREIPAYVRTPAVFVSSMDEETLAAGATASGGTFALRKSGGFLDALAGWLEANLTPAA